MRNHLDFYETPPWQTKSLLSRVRIEGSVFECCVGDRSIANVFGSGVRVVTNDINTARSANYHFDATQPKNWSSIAVDWVVTNPPFNQAIEIVKNAHNHARIGVAMLLRLSFLEPTEKRGGYMASTPPTAMLVLPRWSYKQNRKTDSVTTAWMIWLKQPYGPPFMEGARPMVNPLIQIVPKSEIRYH